MESKNRGRDALSEEFRGRGLSTTPPCTKPPATRGRWQSVKTLPLPAPCPTGA